jgi:hypothetical protein
VTACKGCAWVFRVDTFFDRLDDDVRLAVEQALGVPKEQGTEISEVELADSEP